MIRATYLLLSIFSLIFFVTAYLSPYPLAEVSGSDKDPAGCNPQKFCVGKKLGDKNKEADCQKDQKNQSNNKKDGLEGQPCQVTGGNGTICKGTCTGKDDMTCKTDSNTCTSPGKDALSKPEGQGKGKEDPKKEDKPPEGKPPEPPKIPEPPPPKEKPPEEPKSDPCKDNPFAPECQKSDAQGVAQKVAETVKGVGESAKKGFMTIVNYGTQKATKAVESAQNAVASFVGGTSVSVEPAQQAGTGNFGESGSGRVVSESSGFAPTANTGFSEPLGLFSQFSEWASNLFSF